MALPMVFFAIPAFAADCTGNIVEGILTTESGVLIYMNSDSWDAANPGDLSPYAFDTFYDTSDGATPWSGQAWAESADGNVVIGWVNFDGMSAVFAEPNDSLTEWGGWDGSIDLSGISFVGPGFSGITTSGTYTGGGPGDLADWFTGVGDINFSGASLTGEMGGGCPVGEVNLFVNGVPSYMESGSCPLTSVTLTWSSTDVSGCETGLGDWSGDGPRPVNNFAGETASISIDDGETQFFTLICLEDGTGDPVTGVSLVGCSDPGDGGGGGTGPGPGDGVIIPDYIQT